MSTKKPAINPDDVPGTSVNDAAEPDAEVNEKKIDKEETEIQKQNRSKLFLLKFQKNASVVDPYTVSPNGMTRSFKHGGFGVVNESILDILKNAIVQSIDPDTRAVEKTHRIGYTNYGEVPENLCALIRHPDKKKHLDADEVARRMGHLQEDAVDELAA